MTHHYDVPCPPGVPLHACVIEHGWVMRRARCNLKDVLVEHRLRDRKASVSTAIFRDSKPEFKVSGVVRRDTNNDPGDAARAVAHDWCLRTLVVVREIRLPETHAKVQVSVMEAMHR